MSILEPANGGNPSTNLSCPHCNTQLLPEAAFCSFCGERIKKKGETEVRASLSAEPTAPSIPVPGVDTKKHPFSQPMWQRVTRPLSSVSPLPQRKVAWNRSRSDWLWPTIIILSAVAAGLVNFAFTDTAIRPIVVFWFLLVCPGMALVRFLRLKEPIIEWTLALALSFAIDATVAGIQLYAGRWSPTGILEILMGLSVGGALMQLLTMGSAPRLVPKRLHLVLSKQRSVLIPISLILLVGISLGGIGTGIWFYLVYQNSHSTPSTVVHPSKAIPHPSPTPSSMATVNIAGSYYGTLHDIPTGMTTNISLTRIQQQQRNISGYFGGMPTSGVFNGIPQNGAFTGTITTAKQIQFVVTSNTGQATFSFTGLMQPDGTIAGTYCNLEAATGKCSDYGLWSVSPATGPST